MEVATCIHYYFYLVMDIMAEVAVDVHFIILDIVDAVDHIDMEDIVNR